MSCLERAPERALLSLDNVVTSYGRGPGRRANGVRAIDGVSLELRKGELVALIGESGSGKSTLASTALRLLTPDAGRVLFDGQDITRLRQRRLRAVRRRMQVVFQDPYEALDRRFTVRQIIEEPLLVHRLGAGKQDRGRLVHAALERTGLAPAHLFADRYPHQLSGGQRQRVAIAASLVLDPDLLIADEPVSMLDVSARAGVLALLDDLRRGGNMGVLMITHDLSVAAHYADRIAVMYLGRIVEEGPARDVVRDPAHPYTRALLSVVPPKDPLVEARPEPLVGEIPSLSAIPAGCRFVGRCPLATAACSETDPPLRPIDQRREVACIHATPQPVPLISRRSP
ncbi:MAG: ABC transporter ATP-binding protein, partial [Nocardioidaceae bacterium]